MWIHLSPVWFRFEGLGCKLMGLGSRLYPGRFEVIWGSESIDMTYIHWTPKKVYKPTHLRGALGSGYYTATSLYI